jgi:hypothetical protein
MTHPAKAKPAAATTNPAHAIRPTRPTLSPYTVCFVVVERSFGPEDRLNIIAVLQAFLSNPKQRPRRMKDIIAASDATP